MTSTGWTRVPAGAILSLVLLLNRVAVAPRPDRPLALVENVSATVNATVLDGRRNVVHMMSRDDGIYGQNSPKIDTKGIVITPAPHHGGVDRQGCDPNTRFLVPPRTVQWVALLQRGNCTFKEKIMKAATFNATAVLIYNNSTDKTVKMGHEGTGDTVAVMITEEYGKEIQAHLDRNLTVLVNVVVGQRSPNKNINRGSLVFVSISFIVLMIISSAWLIFYFIQKIRYTNARDRSQRRLGDAAKKAIGKLTTRTVKKGDKETDPDFNHCAVCIEAYQLNDVVRILPCKHVFHKVCVDPWLNEHCTCPMCKLNILKALGIVNSLPCVDSAVLDVDHLGVRQPSSIQRAPLSDSSQTSISLEPLSPRHPEATPRAPPDISVAVTSAGHFFTRNSSSPRSVVCEMELQNIQASLDLYDDNKS
ncbi:E3 ubiquitin-protein ligase RNF130 [Thalassophryne amazonica]|uniref:E3 ubiquitin-protein ligase RNF130 n=1 Tax=Thalassophryne amazonica TaxID=390379 RepID=UPI0014724A4F|nr:E3 ubiquitin-protein ligase RNF130 [Thalassophryne amazonica]XP_034038118.1 E3 ubiquitin-protein ligase RNF130 [Thalassophryne amazonica]XP_034038119.1 E3 ubiquitin-protein ligase RNF130 [Thalassophryne amazonica]